MRLSEFPILDEIKTEYINVRQKGLSRSEAEEKLCNSYHNEITYGEEDDALLFWIGLADAEYTLKELSETVAEKGIHAIDKLEQLDVPISVSDLRRRREHYSHAPMQEKVKVLKSKKFRCAWQVGDTFAYKLSGPDADKAGLEGRYVLLRKVDELEAYDGRILPIVTVTMWDDQELPHSSTEFQRYPILKLASGRLGLPETLVEYRMELMFRSKQALTKLSLVYLGNFSDVEMPNDEVIIREPGYNLMVHPDLLTQICIAYWESNKL